MKEPSLIFPDRARPEEDRVSTRVETSWKIARADSAPSSAWNRTSPKLRFAGRVARPRLGVRPSGNSAGISHVNPKGLEPRPVRERGLTLASTWDSPLPDGRGSENSNSECSKPSLTRRVGMSPALTRRVSEGPAADRDLEFPDSLTARCGNVFARATCANSGVYRPRSQQVAAGRDTEMLLCWTVVRSPGNMKFP
jgi:hypothetical protein